MTRPRRSLAGAHPELVGDFHPSRNGDLDPRELTPSSRRRVWWMCARGHEWQARIDNRAAGTGCPTCSGRLVAPEDSLVSVAPGLVLEWHTARNGVLRPNEVGPGSDRRVWWRCTHGHEWCASVRNRTNGSGCPFCSGKRVDPNRSLAALQPTIAAEWHPTRNGDLAPADVAPQSNQRVWWICKRGHEWSVAIVSRVRSGSGCPRCATSTQKGVPMIAVQPTLADEWDRTLNVGSPDDVSAGSHRRVWWRCAADGTHLWRAQVRNRVRRGSGCPYCAGRLPTSERSLAATLPDLIAEWHPELNSELSPSDLLPFSNRVVWWCCPLGHTWAARIANRAHGSGCPQCASRCLASTGSERGVSF